MSFKFWFNHFHVTGLKLNQRKRGVFQQRSLELHKDAEQLNQHATAARSRKEAERIRRQSSWEKLTIPPTPL
jgi:hypothetical protein